MKRAGLPILTFLAALPAAWYIFQSRGHPQFLSLLLSSVALGVIVGILTSLVASLVEGRAFDRRQAFLVGAALPIALAAILVAENRPENIRREFRISLLFDQSTGELPFVGFFPRARADECYSDISAIVKNYAGQDADKRRRIDALVPPVGEGPALGEAVQLLRDLGEYGLVYCMGTYLVGDSNDPQEFYRPGGVGVRSLVAMPDPAIGGTEIEIGQISGDFSRNSFIGIDGNPLARMIKVRVPTGTTATTRHNETISASTLILENGYQTISITVQPLPAYGPIVALSPQTYLPRINSGLMGWGNLAEVQPRRYRLYEIMLYLEADFDRLRYSFPAMKYHRQWALDLFDSLEEKFTAWPLITANPAEAERETRAMFREMDLPYPIIEPNN